MKQQLVAGIDIGGTNTVFGLVNEGGNILASGNVKTTDFPDPQLLTTVVSEKINSILPANTELRGVGIGAPNGNFFNGSIEFAPNLKWKGVVPLAKYFSESLHRNAVLTNDANAAAMGEMIFGAAKGMKDFLFITLGTGLGSGIVVNGKIVYGHDSFAGEIGHVIMFPEGRQCGCGRKGCLETYCSAAGIVKTYCDLKSIPVSSETDAKYIYEKAMEGEKNAIDSFNYTGDILGLALANSVVYTSPEIIFLFGGIAQAGEFIFKPTIASFEKNILNIFKGRIKIAPSRLKESDAAILGAASLIWNELHSLHVSVPHDKSKNSLKKFRLFHLSITNFVM